MVDITDLKSVEPKALAGSSPAAGTSKLIKILASDELAEKTS